MKFTPKRTKGSAGVPIFAIKPVLTTLTGGFLLDLTDLEIGKELPKGTIVAVDETTRKAKVVKAASDITGLAGVVKNDEIIEDGTQVTVVIGAVVYENRIPAVSAAIKAKLPGTLIFSKSF